MSQTRFICIHGHFYQPPRENPWLEAIETQDSAHPYHDWNDRITAECYEPNATARILDERGQIRTITNNYGSISFNFGPTLLSWMEACAPRTYAAVLEADRLSREKFSGHGSALAQAYNHMILPLANERDQRTQVRWGIRDFEARFGRRPEGMWLPETAVDIASLEALAAEGIAFTVLEPHQALRWRATAQAHWVEAEGHVDPTRPYVCNLPSGRSIAIFFYDGPISRAVAFENLLSRGEHLAHRLQGAFSPQRPHDELVNIATDGETYGHHHLFGDMALAYALSFIEENEIARLTNYGEYLEFHPPLHEVEIRELTSWSCSHGVERWRSDCGCHAGGGAGWTQQWRRPLRDALDWLRDVAASVYERFAAGVLRDPWNAREEYISVILDRSDESVQRFLAEHAHPDADATRVLELLEMQRNAMLMYTSCGWFFSDLSGIETVQVLHYAARVSQLVESVSGEALDAEFMRRLAEAHSNIPERGSARQIYEREVFPVRVDLGRVASHYAVASLFDQFDDEARVYCYEVSQRSFEIHKAGRTRMALGTIDVRSTITHETASFEFAVLHLGETEITGGVRHARAASETTHVWAALAAAMEPGGIPSVIRLLDQEYNEAPVSIRSLFRDAQRRILGELCTATLVEAESAFRHLHERYDPLMRFHMRLAIPVPKVLQVVAEFDLNLQIRRILEQQVPPLAELSSRLREAKDEGVTLDETTLMAFRRALEAAAERFVDHPDDVDVLEHFEALIGIVRGTQLTVDLRLPQNEYYRMRNTVRPAIAAGAGGAESRQWLALFDELGRGLAISPEAAASSPMQLPTGTHDEH
ncbi:MAG: DUF3536 domain-containing protein [Thermoanaerobaculia bacterium]